MIARHATALLVLVLSLSSGIAHAITLVKDGQPQATIVVRDSAFNAKPWARAYPNPQEIGPDAKVRFAADELQTYIEKITGAKLPIVSDAQDAKGPLVLVGSSKRTQALKLDIPHGVTRDRTDEGYVIHCRGDTLVLAGNEDWKYFGAYYAVAEFLNRVGVRWFMPGEFGEVVPQMKTLKFDDVEFHDKPDFILRTWWGYAPPENLKEEMLWKLRNKMQVNMLMTTAGDSTVRAYMPDKENTKTHPEWFAQNLNGTPDPFNPNLTNPEVPKLVAQKMAEFCAKTLKETGSLPDGIACAPDDGMPVDYSPLTQKANQNFTEIVGREGMAVELSVSEEWFNFINQVARELAKTYPDVLIASNGYANRNMPPEGLKLEPNLSIMYASIWADTLHALDNPRSWHGAVQGAMIKRWCELNPRVHQYGYDYTMLGTNLAPVPTTRKLAHDYPLKKKWGMIGFVDEQKPATYMEQGITTFYTRAKLNWNADLDVDALLSDYFDKWYGKAAKPARAFWDALEECIEKTPILGHEQRILPNVYTNAIIEELEKQVGKAEKLADNDRVKTHVAVDRHILEHLKAYLAMWEADFSANYVEAVHQCDVMTAERAKLNAISPFLNQPERTYEDGLARYYCGTWGEGLIFKKPAYQKMADDISGKSGDLIAMGERRVKFALDEADRGKALRWYDPDFDRGDWMKIDATKAYYLQVPGCFSKDGVPYRGMMWYVHEMDVPESAAGKSVTLYSQAVVTEAWVWVNGEYAGHRPYMEPCTRPAELSLDVTRFLKPGKKNTIAIRVSTATNRTQAPEGFQSRVFLYSPKPLAAPAK